MTYQKADIGERFLAYEIQGNNKPTVILETGLLAESSEWEVIFTSLSAFSRVLRYDRAGRGLSSPGPLPRTAQNAADDLYTLLEVLNVPGPYLLVGQSFGGMVVRRFALEHSEEVCGTILVDTTHEDQFDIIGDALPELNAEAPEAMRHIYQFWKSGYRAPTNNREQIDFPVSCEQMREIKSLGIIPIRILTGGKSAASFASEKSDQDHLQALHNKLHAQLTKLSTNAKQIIVEDCGHFIQREKPEIIIHTVQELIGLCV